MKKILNFLPLLLVAVVGSMMFMSCDDKDEPIAADSLPTQAKTFVSQYFPSATIVTANKDKNDYEVVLSDGTKIDFNKDGEWTDVDAVIGKTIPSGFYPEAIDTYVEANYATAGGINEISKEKRGYDVELVTGLDLVFSLTGDFITIDL